MFRSLARHKYSQSWRLAGRAAQAVEAGQEPRPSIDTQLEMLRRQAEGRPASASLAQARVTQPRPQVRKTPS
jgi:hypothetical protein